MEDPNLNSQTKHYEVSLRPNYVYLRFKGIIDENDLRNSTRDISQLAKSQNVYLLLDDIRGVDRASVTIHLQTEAIGQLWHMRIFKKIAILYGDNEIGRLVKGTLETIRFIPKCRAFDNEADAVAWLQADD